MYKRDPAPANGRYHLPSEVCRQLFLYENLAIHKKETGLTDYVCLSCVKADLGRTVLL